MVGGFCTLEDAALAGKRVLLRVDLNVPMKNGAVSDATRLERVTPTIAEIADKGGKVILLSHLGRPKGRDAALSLRPVATALAAMLNRPVGFVEDCVGPAAHAAVAAMQPGDIVCLENTRFHGGEESNDQAFVAALAELGDLWINDAFSAAHRAHASTEGLGHLLPAYAGRAMQAELHALGKALETPEHPVMAIVGGAKVSSKAGVLRFLLPRVDALLLGGAMANTFFKAAGKEVGASLVEDQALDTARAVEREGGGKLVLPVDAVCARAVEPGQETVVRPVDGVDDGWMIVDAGPATIRRFAERLQDAGTVIWNGPVGVFEVPEFSEGTRAVGEAVAASGAYSLVGGGDTAAAVEALGLSGRFSHVSTGGGATLEYMEGRELPGVAVLRDRR